MRLLCPVLLSTALAAGLIAGRGAARAGSSAAQQHRAPSPVVIEWFARPTAAVGQREVVYARLLDRDRPLPGARLTAQVRLSGRVLLVLHGSTTGRTGTASAPFTVPPSARGKVVAVTVSLAYRQYHFPGRNDLKIRQ